MSHLHREAKEEEDASLGFAGLGADFKNAAPLWNSEVKFILENFKEKNIKSDQESSLVDETLDYVKLCNNYDNTAQIDEAKVVAAKFEHLINSWEMALINNLRVLDPDECVALIPTLKEKVEAGTVSIRQIEELLEEMKKFQKVSDK